jgi:hypothetical protein
LQIIGEGGDILVAVDYLGTVHDVTASAPIGPLTLTSVAVNDFVLTQTTLSTFAITSVVASTGVYTGTFTGGAANAFAGQTAVILGFVTAGNNGSFVITASSATTITVTPTTQADETHAATASVTGFSTATYTGTITGGDTNAYAGSTVSVLGFVNAGNNVTAQNITASTATTLVTLFTTQINETHAGTARVAGVTLATYNGTITGGALSAFAGRNLNITGFAGGGNNVTNQTIVSSTATTLVVAATTQVTETHAATANITASYTPANGTRLNQYFTRLLPGATIAALFTDAFANPSLLDIVHVIVPNSGNIVYVLDHLGVASGS